MANNSFSTFFGAVFPAVGNVLSGSPTYGDSQNVLDGTAVVPAASDVRFGVPVGAVNGTCRVPTANNVRTGIQVDATSGTCAVPSPNFVNVGIGIDNTVGNVTLPATGDVRLGTTYGSNLSQTGSLVVSGGTIPDPGDVRFGVAVGAGTGTCVVPIPQNVRLGTAVDVAFTGQIAVPAPGNVRSGIDVDVASSGTVNVPAASNVVLGVSVDVAGTGTVRIPAEADVRLGVDYGASDSLEGTLDPGAGGVVPSPNDVRFGVDVGLTTGLAKIPTADEVLNGVNVDVADIGNVVMPTEAQVLNPVLFGPQASLQGAVFLPTTANVRSGVAFGVDNLQMGLLTLPSINDVQTGVQFDNATKTGVFDWPDEAEVLDGVGYGANGVEFTGSLDPGAAGTVPNPADVRKNVPVGFSVGVAHIPAALDVRQGVFVDMTIGTLQVPDIGDVREGVFFDAPAKIGVLGLPLQAQVLSGVGYGANDTEFTGTYVTVAAANVRAGITYGAGSALSGILNLPSINNVRLGITFDNGTKTGNVRLPIESDVAAGVDYDSLDSREGTLDVTGDPPVFPAVSDVRLGVTYGTTVNPTQFTGNVRVPPANKVELGYAFDTADSVTGTLVTGTVPEPEDVRFGVSYGQADALTGVLELPMESQVLLGVGYGAYGTEFEGTLVDVPGGSGGSQSPVAPAGNLRSPLFIGDAYETGNGRAFIWDVTLPFDPTTARFMGRLECASCSEAYAWDVAGIAADNGDGTWKLTFELDAAATAAIAEGLHNWWVVVDDEVTVVSSDQFWSVEWVCR